MPTLIRGYSRTEYVSTIKSQSTRIIFHQHQFLCVQILRCWYIVCILCVWDSCLGRWEINVNSHFGLKLGQERRKVDCKLEGGQYKNVAENRTCWAIHFHQPIIHLFSTQLFSPSKHLGLVRFSSFIFRNSCNDGVHSSSISHRNLLVNYYTAETTPLVYPPFISVGWTRRLQCL